MEDLKLLKSEMADILRFLVATLGCGVYFVENNSLLKLIDPLNELVSFDRPMLLSDKVLAKKWDTELAVFDPRGPMEFERLQSNKGKNLSFKLKSQICNILQGPKDYYLVQCQEQVYKLNGERLDELPLGAYDHSRVNLTTLNSDNQQRDRKYLLSSGVGSKRVR